MGKHGPCCHCGVTSTPLWRNGPPEKPVLCNACGSRWRTKGSLVNYTPLHSRPEPEEFDHCRFPKVKKFVPIKNKETKVLKRKMDIHDIPEFGVFPPEYNPGFRKAFDEDISNRSSSGSAISNSESYPLYGSADASDLTGPSQPVIWDSTVPSRKRTCVSRPKQSKVEKLTKDLYTIWHEQQSSCLSGSSEEDLLLESDRPMVSVEIGHGSVLIRHPSSIARDEESEASSFSIDNKQDTLISSSKGIEKIKKPTNQWAEQERIKRDKDQLEKLQILAHHNSPLCHIDLQEIMNFETFASHLTSDEQHQLLKFLPSIDTLEAPFRETVPMSSLKSMFNSPQFKENFLPFQKLLADGVFDNSFSGASTEDCRILKKLILGNSTKSKWVEQYEVFKDLKRKNSSNESEFVGELNALETEHSASTKRSRDGQHQKFAGAKVIMKSPRRILMKSSYDHKEPITKDVSFSSGKSLFSSQNDNNFSLVLDSSHFSGESSDQDLLLDIPSNSFFPQAELLLPSSSFGALASTSSSSIYPNLVGR